VMVIETGLWWPRPYPATGYSDVAIGPR
jgi:hypothetical protein